MQHVRHREVLHVEVRAEAFRRDIRPPQRFADDRVARGILQRCFGIELEIELFAGDQAMEIVRGLDPERVDVEVVAIVIDEVSAACLRRQADQERSDATQARDGLAGRQATLDQQRTALLDARTKKQESVDDAMLMIEAEKLCADFAQGPTVAFDLIKRALDAAENNDLATQLDLERQSQREAGSTNDYKGAVRAFLDKRKPTFTGKR